MRVMFNGVERRSYPIADMIISRQQLISRISSVNGNTTRKMSRERIVTRHQTDRNKHLLWEES